MPAEWSAIVYFTCQFRACRLYACRATPIGWAFKRFSKQENFEAGVVSAGTARIRLSAKFYLVAIFFVIFDLEALYLYAYAVSVREVGWAGFASAFVLLPFYLWGLVYEMRLGAMNWAPADKRIKKNAF